MGKVRSWFGRLSRAFDGGRGRRRRAPARSRARLGGVGVGEVLEARALLATTAAAVAMIDATTLDSRSLTVDYRVGPADAGRPITLGVYRGTSASFDANTTGVATMTVPATAVDATGRPATAAGSHNLTVAVPGGLPPDPSHPFVVVVADPGAPGQTPTGQVATFRKYTIGVIVHGGLQPNGWKQNGPPWMQTVAALMKSEGYDVVIPYNWVAQSATAGAAARQIVPLANLIGAAALKLPPGSPVDLHLIGHSEGAVIASQALFHLPNTPNIPRGYVELTLLDPHAASNAVKGTQVSVANNLQGALAKAMIDDYQSRAGDPLTYIAPNVDDAQVYYQHTPVNQAYGSNGGLYNLWGQVPVASAPGVPVHTANLTGPGISHAGTFSVYDWYMVNVAPLLGNGPAFVDPSALSAVRAVSGDPATSPSTVAGTAAPGATVQVLALPIGAKSPTPIATTKADASGSFSVVGLPASTGRYFVKAAVPAMPGLARVFIAPMTEARTVQVG